MSHLSALNPKRMLMCFGDMEIGMRMRDEELGGEKARKREREGVQESNEVGRQWVQVGIGALL